MTVLLNLMPAEGRDEALRKVTASTSPFREQVQAKVEAKGPRSGWPAARPSARGTRRSSGPAPTPATAFGGLFRACDRATPDFGEADRCFEVIRAVTYVGQYQETYQRDPGLLGPNVRANYEQGATMSLSDFAWAHVEQTRIYRRVQASSGSTTPSSRRRCRSRRSPGSSPTWWRWTASRRGPISTGWR